MKYKNVLLLGMFFYLAMMLNACIPKEQSPPSTSGIVSGKICYPSDHLPAMTLYFESTTDDRLISYQTHEDQNSYVVELEPGIYYAYAWLLEDILGGGMYSKAVPCGLKADCTDHSLIPVVVESKQETSGVDICDWNAPLGGVPLPSGKIEGMIADFLREEHPDLAADFEPVLQEMSMQGEVLKKLSARVFRITEGLFEHETFLVTYHGKVIQMGTAIGGRGVSSMALSDLDQDGHAELYFSYSFGSGVHQSHLGVYAPAHNPEKIYEAKTYYLGDLMLFSERENQVSVRVVEGEPETTTIKYRETLGQLKLEKIDLSPILRLELVDSLPDEIRDNLVQPENSGSGNGLWIVYEDEQYGVRFAVPCFWEVNFPDQYHPSGTGYPIRNYTETFAMSFGKKQDAVWENGGIKIDMIFLSGENWGLPDDATLEDFLTVNNTDPDPSVEILSFEQVLINKQKGLLVKTKGQFGGIHSYHLFKVSENLFLDFGVYPPQAIDNPDVQGILHSLALSSEVDVAVPEIIPGDSPQEDTPTCLHSSE